MPPRPLELEKKHGSLKVKVLSVVDLPWPFTYTGNAFVVMKIAQQMDKQQAKNGGHNCEWGSESYFNIPLPANQYLRLEVGGKNEQGKDTIISKGSLPLSPLLQGVPAPRDVQLEPGGILQVELEARDFATDQSKETQENNNTQPNESNNNNNNASPSYRLDNIVPYTPASTDRSRPSPTQSYALTDPFFDPNQQFHHHHQHNQHHHHHHLHHHHHHHHHQHHHHFHQQLYYEDQTRQSPPPPCEDVDGEELDEDGEPLGPVKVKVWLARALNMPRSSRELYVVLRLGEEQVYQSRTVKAGQDAIWDQEFEFSTHQIMKGGRSVINGRLEVDVMELGESGRDVICRQWIDLSNYHFGGVAPVRLALKDPGVLELEIMANKIRSPMDVGAVPPSPGMDTQYWTPNPTNEDYLMNGEASPRYDGYLPHSTSSPQFNSSGYPRGHYRHVPSPHSPRPNPISVSPHYPPTNEMPMYSQPPPFQQQHQHITRSPSMQYAAPSPTSSPLPYHSPQHIRRITPMYGMRDSPRYDDQQDNVNRYYGPPDMNVSNRNNINGSLPNPYENPRDTVEEFYLWRCNGPLYNGPN